MSAVNEHHHSAFFETTGPTATSSVANPQKETGCCVNPALVDLLETTIAHVLPGAIFLVYGLWWALASSWTDTNRKLLERYRDRCGEKGRKKRHAGRHDRDEWYDKSWLPHFTCCKLPVEPLVKTLLPLIGIVEESIDIGRDPMTSRTYLKLYRATKPDGSFGDLAQLQHITMYASFMLSGLIDLASLSLPLPKRTSTFFLAGAFLVEGILFYLHSPFEKPTLSTQLHWMVAVSVFVCALFAALRVWQPASFLVNGGLAFSITFQGVWLMQVGTLLHGEGKAGHGGSGSASPAEHETATMKEIGHGDVHSVVMFAAICFVWNIIVIGLFLLATRVIAQKVRGWLCLSGNKASPNEGEESIPLTANSNV